MPALKVACDLHVHTNISKCGAPEATAESCLEAAAKEGLKIVGFSNHCWANHLPGASDWYKGQDVEHVLQIRSEIPSPPGNVRVLIGCETEYIGNGVAGMDKETTALFDYVLIPANHFHMRGYTVPEDLGAGGPGAVRELLYRRFLEAVDLGFGTGIVHPFGPLGFMDWEEEVMSGFTRAQYETCFKAAASAGIGVEIHHMAIECKAALNAEGFSTLYINMLSTARECGCKFFFASDAHTPKNMNGYDRLGQLAGLCGIDEGMILQWD
jgi:histidinol phosphatase-like PHP family hydrolase